MASSLTDILSVKPDGTKTIVLSEGADPRVAQAAVTASKANMAQIICVGTAADVTATLKDAGDDGAVQVADPATSDRLQTYAETYATARAAKGMTVEKALVELATPHFFAAAMVANGDADGTIGGAVYATPDIIRAALKVIGTAPDTSLLSSFFFIVFDGRDDLPSQVNIFSDAGLVIDPDASEMADIAIASAQSMKGLTGINPKIAMLSFSTKGSAHHMAVTKVEQATGLVRDRRPDLAVDGELQFDAALVPAVAARKAPGSDVAGQANTFIFPNLDAGNIGYKIAQRFGGARAIGPILQGLAKPANDLSRGATADDIVDMIAVTLA
ncbi:MAG: phosphate acetyltransferase, partial [Pseudomonadota bacterium]